MTEGRRQQIGRYSKEGNIKRFEKKEWRKNAHLGTRMTLYMVYVAQIFIALVNFVSLLLLFFVYIPQTKGKIRSRIVLTDNVELNEVAHLGLSGHLTLVSAGVPLLHVAHL